mmetsp:Transcript_52/g.102  ORF Transcript_52/g.102 Transcript_52/m.102 type:complete len:152 (+) Transcript_52:228-683(+)
MMYIDTRQGEIVWEASAAHPIQAASTTARLVASSHSDGGVSLLDRRASTSTHLATLPSSGAVDGSGPTTAACIAIDPTDSGCVALAGHGRGVAVWDVHAGQSTFTHTGHDSDAHITALFWPSGLGGCVASASSTPDLQLWKPNHPAATSST